MKAQEIREKFNKNPACLEYDIQIEMCAQLAEMNEALRDISSSLASLDEHGIATLEQ